MSGHGHHDDTELHSSHDDHHETSSDDFPADEPRSPGWLPLLGGALLLAGVFGCMVFGSDDKPAAVGADSDAPAAPAAAPPPPSPAPSANRPAAALPPGAAFPAGHQQFVQRPLPHP